MTRPSRSVARPRHTPLLTKPPPSAGPENLMLYFILFRPPPPFFYATKGLRNSPVSAPRAGGSAQAPSPAPSRVVTWARCPPGRCWCPAASWAPGCSPVPAPPATRAARCAAVATPSLQRDPANSRLRSSRTTAATDGRRRKPLLPLLRLPAPAAGLSARL